MLSSALVASGLCRKMAELPCSHASRSMPSWSYCSTRAPALFAIYSMSLAFVRHIGRRDVFPSVDEVGLGGEDMDQVGFGVCQIEPRIGARLSLSGIDEVADRSILSAVVMVETLVARCLE